MLEVQSFNNLLSASNSFNQMFANISTTPPSSDLISTIPTASASTSTAAAIIDLSSENDEDFEIVSAAAGRKRQHTIIENQNDNKRNRQNDINVQHQNHRLYTDQKNVPLKKRGVNNSSQRRNDSELSFLNRIGTDEDPSNQAQDLKLKVVCDNSGSMKTASMLKHSRQYQKPEEGTASASTSSPSPSSICNCFECFPSLGANSGIRPKCNKINQQERPSTSSVSVDSKIDLDRSMIPGPSGLQKKKMKEPGSISMPVKKRNNYYESDDDYDSDENIESTPRGEDTERDGQKDTTLEAPHLQLDWLSDSSSNQGEIETDDDVIFVSDRAEPIDLTADSDSEMDSRANTQRLPLSIDRVDRSNASDVPNPTRNHRIWSPIDIDEPPSYNPPNSNTISSARAPIMSSVALPAAPQVLITMNTRRTTPVPARTINFHDMITGNDVMLYDGVASAQNFSSQQSRSSAGVEPPVSSETRPPSNLFLEQPNFSRRTHSHHHHHHQHHSQQQNHHHHPNSNIAHSNNNLQNNHHRRHHFFTSHGASPQTQTQEINEGATNGGGQQEQSQNCRQHVRCPFMTEGHHYNRPRRLPRDFYPISNSGRPPYAVHEDLWRRQYQVLKIFKFFIVPSF